MKTLARGFGKRCVQAIWRCVQAIWCISSRILLSRTSTLEKLGFVLGYCLIYVRSSDIAMHLHLYLTMRVTRQNPKEPIINAGYEF